MPYFAKLRSVQATEPSRRSKLGGGGTAMLALGLIGDVETIPHARKALTDAGLVTRYIAAITLVRLGGVEEGTKALARLTDTSLEDDASGYYRSMAAEALVRLGDRAFLGDLIGLAATRSDHADDGISVLADLTGVYFPTLDGWQRWWREHGERRK